MRLPLVLAGALAALLVGALIALGVAIAEDHDPTTSGVEPGGARTPAGRAWQASIALRGWDLGRARAWASGDATALASLYAPGSVAGRRDVRMLRRWHERGLVVRGMRTQVLAVEVEHSDSDRWVLLVTDRLAGGLAVGRGRRVALPVDRATRRRVTLLRAEGRWTVSSVLPLP